MDYGKQAALLSVKPPTTLRSSLGATGMVGKRETNAKRGKERKKEEKKEGTVRYLGIVRRMNVAWVERQNGASRWGQTRGQVLLVASLSRGCTFL